MKRKFKQKTGKLLAMVMSVLMLVGMSAIGVQAVAEDTGNTRGALSLDNVTINSFKVIDVTHGNVEIDYKTSDQADYAAYSADPTKFANDANDNQVASTIKLELGLQYSSDTPIKEGDTLTIPASYGGRLENFTSQKLLDGSNNELGTWEYNNGAVVIKFSGNYINNNVVKKFTAVFKTGEIKNYMEQEGYSFVKGERALVKGKLGKNDLCLAFEKKYVFTANINKTEKFQNKSAGGSSDSHITWVYKIYNDKYFDKTSKETFFSPYMLENNGQYAPNSYTGVYIEDTFYGCNAAPIIGRATNQAFVSGITDDGKVISGYYGLGLPATILKKIDQGTKSKSEIKDSLNSGEYCMYDNYDGSYTLMLKWGNMKDGTGTTYNDVPAIQSAGGVGSWLKNTYPAIYGDLSDATIEKINKMHDRKALQNIHLYVHAPYAPVKERTEVDNTAKITTDQSGENEYTATGVLTPPAGIADAPADPLAIKMLKTDKDTGADLSTGFTFELQTSTDNGTNWTKVDLDASMVEIGTLNGDKTVTPDAKGVVQVKKLTGGNMYRFVEKTHADGYQNVSVNNDQPNDKAHTTSANSKAVTITAQGQGHVIVMYNAKPAKTVVKVTKKWVGPEKDSVTVNLLADGEGTGKTLTLNKDGNWEGAFEDLLKYNADGNEIQYDIKEVEISNYDSIKTGDAKIGFTITNTNTEKVNVKVTKKWVGEAAAKAEVKLLADGNEKESATLTKEGGWNHTFKDLPKYDAADGHEIVYTVKETPLTYYDTAVSGSSKDGFVVTNTHNPPPPPTYATLKVPITAHKQLKNGVLSAGQFTFLLKDGKGKVIEKATNDANGNIVFSDRTFSREVSNYLYTIEEESGSLKGITYDRTIYTLKVTTTATGGQLKAKVDILKDNVPYDGSVRFVNVRKAPPTGDGTLGMVMLLSLMALGLAGTALYAGKRAGKRTN